MIVTQKSEVDCERRLGFIEVNASCFSARLAASLSLKPLTGKSSVTFIKDLYNNSLPGLEYFCKVTRLSR